MIDKQLKELPSVSQVILEINDNISLNIKYIKYIINSEIKLYRKLAKANKLKYKRRDIINKIVRNKCIKF